MIQTQSTTQIYCVNPLPEERNDDFYYTPDSRVSQLVLDALGAGKYIDELPSRKCQINHNTAYTLVAKDGKHIITSNNCNGEISLTLSDLTHLTGTNKAAKKLFVLALIKVNEQAVRDTKLVCHYVSFPLQELVDIGFYTSIRSARNGFNREKDSLTQLEVQGSFRGVRRKKYSVDTMTALFSNAFIKNGQCYIYMNTTIDWGFLIQYFTVLPRYYFHLSNRASDLLYYIFYLARQNTQELESHGYFMISFRALQHKLMIPSEEGQDHIQRDIKEAIEGTVSQLLEAHRKYCGDEKFSLTRVCGSCRTTKEYLDNSHLKVEIGGKFASKFIAFNRRTINKIEEKRGRQAKNKEKTPAVAN